MIKSESISVRSRIMERLNATHARSLFAEKTETPEIPTPSWSKEEKIYRLKSMMEAAQTEVQLCSERGFSKILRQVVKEKQLKRLLYSKDTTLGMKLQTMKKRTPKTLPELVSYDDSIETCKKTLFSIDAALTNTLGGIAETGSLILWPSAEEPRLMSLVPPVHLAVLKAELIFPTFAEALRKGNWSEGMPSNALLISGPSKTADIEQTLVYGVHGPKQLVVFVIQPS